MTSTLVVTLLLLSSSSAGALDLDKARDQQDRVTLERLISEASAQAQKQPNDAAAQYQLARAQSYLAEVLIELNDKNQSKTAAENGMKAAERAVSLKPDKAEYHRMLGTLCGQVIPANVIAGLRYGKCALESVNKAIEMDPKSSDNYVSHGVGNYYLPPAFGGGIELAIKDFQKAIELNPKSTDAHLWLGVALRKAHHNADARKEFQQALELNPNRLWAKQQLDKTPAQ